ncbi:hypothetical protein [Sinomonas sp. P47F7]|uniref:hypothetical protein n=1 Tax=Sinomonas sp. P47F7 TaxID=3410987 RepID=UPI003BF481CE
MLTLGIATAIAATAGARQFQIDAHEQLRAGAAQQLATPASGPSQGTAPAAPAAGPTAASTRTAAASSAAAPTAVGSPAVSHGPSIALPLTRFSWPAAGLTVSVVPTAWSKDQPVDPPLDANNFDPVAHWLAGTGESDEVRPIVLAAHSCHQAVALCNDATFPFNRLSFAGWEIGQAATATDALGKMVQCALASREVVDKSKAFSFANDPCLVVVFSCNYENPDGQIVLLTFRCGQCT